MLAGRNPYAPMAGMPGLHQAIVDKVASPYGAHFDVDSEVTVTAGATQAIFTAITVFVRPGDVVIV
jgi:methionine aminotransferase